MTCYNYCIRDRHAPASLQGESRYGVHSIRADALASLQTGHVTAPIMYWGGGQRGGVEGGYNSQFTISQTASNTINLKAICYDCNVVFDNKKTIKLNLYSHKV